MSKKEQKLIDILFLMFIIGIFIQTSYITINSRDVDIEGVILLFLQFVSILIGYFFGLIPSIISSVLIIFGYGSIILYQNVMNGEPVKINVYFWFMLIAYSSIIIGLFNNYIKRIININKNLSSNYENFVSVDSITKLENTKAFYNELSQSMSLSKRFNISLILMLIKIDHFEEIGKIVGKIKMEEILKTLSESIVNATRLEDKCFILDNYDTFGLVLHTDIKGADALKNRLKDDVKIANLKLFSKDVKVNLHLKIGYSLYEENQDILGLKKQAEKEMEYDV